MGYVFSAIEKLGPAGLVLKAILGSLLGIFLLIGFIILRRWYRATLLSPKKRADPGPAHAVGRHCLRKSPAAGLAP